jgi:hypothetical protein
MIFKMYNCDFVYTVDDVSYTFEHTDSVTIEDPEATRLTRGSNAFNKVGLVYTEGTKDPKRVTVTLLGVSAEINELFAEVYKNKTRGEFSVIDRTDGSGKIAKNAILCQMPQQLTIDESPESMNVTVLFDTFDLTEVHKS